MVRFDAFLFVTLLTVFAIGCNEKPNRNESKRQTRIQPPVKRDPIRDEEKVNSVAGKAILEFGNDSSDPSRPPSASQGKKTLGSEANQKRFASFQLLPDTTILELDKKISRVQLSKICEHKPLETLILDGGIEVSGPDETLSHLEKIANLKQLCHLRIRNFNLNDAGIQRLSKLTELRILNFPQANFSDAAMKHLAEMPKLELLRFSSHKVTDAGIKVLSKSKSLRALHLIRIDVTDVIVPAISTMKSLETFYIDGSKMTDAGYSKLIEMRPDLHLHVDQIHLDYDPRKH